MENVQNQSGISRKHIATDPPWIGECERGSCSFIRLAGSLDCAGEIQNLLRPVFDELSQKVPFDWVCVWVQRDDEGNAGTRAIYSEGEMTLRESGAADAKSAAGWAVAHQTNLYRRDIREESSFDTTHEEALGLRSDFIAPLTSAGQLIGTIQVGSRQPEAFSPPIRELLLQVAALLGKALDHRRQFEELRAQLARLGLLDDIARTISASLDAGDVLEIMLREIAHVIPVARMSIAVPADEPNVYRVVVARDESGNSTRPADWVIRADESVMERAFAGGDTYYCRDMRELKHRVERELSRQGLLSALYVPVRTSDRTVACLVLVREDASAFDASEIEFLRKLSGHLATAIRNAELFSELDKSYHRLEAAQEKMVISERLQALGEMGSGVAHDFNNILSIILGNVQLLVGKIDRPDLLRRLTTIEKAALEGSSTVKRLQDFAQLRTDREFIALDLNELIGDVIDLARTRWSGRADAAEMKWDIAFEPKTGGTALVRGNAADLREVFSSIVFNAFEAMPDGGQIRILTERNEDSVTTEISDSGPGIPEEICSRIFEPFFTTKGVRTTGLGLSVTYGIVARHSGDITVRNQPGNGATFTVRLPLEHAEQIKPPEEPVRRVEPSGNLKPRILVVDDEDDIRQLLEEILVQSGYDVDVASGGHEALGRFGANHFDLVLTDLGMPDLTGWDVAEKVKTTRPDVKVAIITGWGCSVAKDDPRMVHVDVLMAKPVSIVELNENIEKLLREKK